MGVSPGGAWIWMPLGFTVGTESSPAGRSGGDGLEAQRLARLQAQAPEAIAEFLQSLQQGCGIAVGDPTGLEGRQLLLQGFDRHGHQQQAVVRRRPP